MCITRYYQRRQCSLGNHKWSWTSEEREIGTEGKCVRHMCARCSAWSNWVVSSKIVRWRATNGLLDMQTFYPDAWKARRTSHIAFWMIWVILAAAFASFYGWRNAYATGACLILSMASWVLSSAAKADMEDLMKESAR